MKIDELIGSLSKYQLWLCSIVFLSKFGAAFHQMAHIFLAPPVQYFCPDTNATCCDNPVYNKTIFTRTIVTEFHLICDKSWLKDLTETLFQIGVLSGSLLCGMASDRFGRRKTLIDCVILQLFMGLLASFSPEYWTFTAARMTLGFSVGGILVVGFVMIVEYSGHEYRDVVSALYHIPFTTGYILLALFGYLIRDYVYFQLGISLSSIILLTYICILPESPRWLLAVDKTTEAVELMERIAKINNLPTEHIERKVELYQLEHKNHTRSCCWDLFRTPNMRKHMLVMSFLCVVCSYYFYAASYYICHLTEDLYINVAATGAICACSCLVSIPLMRYLNRKKVVLLSYGACSLCLLTIAAIPEGKGSIICACIGLLFSYVMFVVSYLYCSEMFPTVVRNSAIGIASMTARTGAMVAPMATLKPYGKWTALIAFVMLPIAVTLLWICLPETKGIELMMTLEEGENLGKRTQPQETAAQFTLGDIS